MSVARFITRVGQGLPFLRKELEDEVSSRTPFFISSPRFVYISQYEVPCNGRCIMCYYGQRNRREPLRSRSGRYLSGEQFIKLLRDLKKLGGSGIAVSFTGGEPLLYRPIYDIVSLASNLGQLFSLTTNGYLLTENNTKRLVENGLFNIGVSLEAIDPAINETLRPFPQGTRLAMKGIDRILRHRERCKSPISVNIKTTITQENFAAYPTLVKWYGKIPSVSVTPQPFTLTDVRMDRELNKRLWVRDIEGLRDVVAELLDLQKQGYSLNIDPSVLNAIPDYFAQHVTNGVVDFEKPVPPEARERRRDANKDCRVGYTTIFVETDGGIRLCIGFPPIGNIHETPDLRTIWHGEKARRVRKAMASCTYVCALSCLRKKTLFQKAKMFLNR